MYKKLLGWLPTQSSLTIWRVLFFASGVLITMGRNDVVSLWPSEDGASGGYSDSEISTAKDAGTGAEAPWGELVSEKLSLQNYDDMFPDGTGQLHAPEWLFENLTREQLLDLLRSAKLTGTEQSVLMNTNAWERSTNGFILRPPDELIAGLSKETRQVLYPVLARSYVNYPQFLCYRFPLDGFDRVFGESSIPGDKLSVLRAMTYTNEGTLCLSIDRSVQDKLTRGEFDQLLRLLFSVKTWRLSLRVTPDSDIDALVNYWGKGGRERVIRPLLESMARQPNGGTLNISYFLPPFARMRLYTYPYAYPGLDVMQEDCFFTARYFFRQETTNPQYDEVPNSADRLLEKCEGTTDQMQFGDMLLLVDSKGRPIHVCVYLAGDFVYTKNGNGFAKPWVIMKIDEMMDDYTKSKPLQIVHMRSKT